MNETISVLVVDDDPNVRSSIARLLRGADYTVFEAENGESCLRIASGKKPDLVLLDVMLPGMNGYEVCRRIKADEEMCNAYVVMFSAKLTDSDNQSDGLENGADGYLVRPISNRELLARIRAAARLIKAERGRDLLIDKLRKALATIKTLSGLLPICSNCKKIRDDRGYWEEVELYVKKHTNAEFSHGICPDCFNNLYGDLGYEEDE